MNDEAPNRPRGPADGPLERAPRSGWRSWQLWIEYGFVCAIIAGLTYTAVFFNKNGFLPQPFFYEPNGTFTDWFTIAFWARHPGAYDIERTIYPPLSFLVMGLFGDDRCYQVPGLEARYCDPWSIAAIVSFYGLAVAVSFWAMFRVDRRTAIPRGFALSFGLPLLYALERGNLVILCYVCVLLGTAPLLRSARLRWLFMGFAVNFKVYVIAAVLAPLLRRRWLAVEGMLLATIGVYLITWVMFGAGTPLEIVNNIYVFSYGFQASPLDLWYTSSYNPALSMMRGTFYPLTIIFGSRPVEIAVVALGIFVTLNQLMVLLAAGASWLKPDAVTTNRVIFLALALALMTSESGGYTQILLLPFVFSEKWHGAARPTALIIAYILCIPMEYLIYGLPSGIIRDSFLSGRHVIVNYGVGLGSLLRPGLIQIMASVLAASTIRDVWQALHADGDIDRWRRRWSATPGIERLDPFVGK